MKKISFEVVDWKNIPEIKKYGSSGISNMQIIEYPGLRIRMVKYSAGYLADHWCQKGHIVHCLEGEVVNEQENGDSFVLKKGMSYVVTNDMSSHRSRAEENVTLLIIDGDFLQSD